MYVYICTDTPVYVCMYVYVYKYTYSNIFVSLHTHTCRSPGIGQRNILDLVGGTTESLGKVGGCNASNLIFRISEGRTSSRLSRRGEGHSLQSAYYTPAATDAYRLLHTHAHTHTPHTGTRATTVKNVHV